MNEYKAVYDGLMRKVQLAEEKYKTAQTRLQAAEVNNDLNVRKITQISVLQQPTTPIDPAKPKKLLTMILAIIIGASFGAAACLISELLDLRFALPEQLSAYLKEPLLASFSYKQMSADGKLFNPSFVERSLQRIGYLPVEEKIPVEKSILSTNKLGALFQSLESLMANQNGRILYMASATMGEGTSTIARELCHFMAGHIGKNVLLIDYYDQAMGASLYEVASGRVELNSAIKTNSVGKGNLSHAYLLSRNENMEILANLPKFESLLSSLKGKFDFIVIPASRVMTETAHMALGRVADGTLFVVEAEKNRAPVTVKAISGMKDAGAKIIGIIFNKRIYYIPKWLYRHI